MASAVGLAINVGLHARLPGASPPVPAPFACAIAGAALGIGLEYVITEFGPEIVDGLIDGYAARRAVGQ